MLTFDNAMADPEDYLPSAPSTRMSDPTTTAVSSALSASSSPLNIQEGVDEVISYLNAKGFVFEPWQVAAFITAVRTKPFVILAGISGTGKTKLPRLIAEATDAECLIVPVRPDWTDSSELLGYERLSGKFQPGALLEFAKKAQESPEKQHFFVLDEMNIARVEYYMAEVLSLIEERSIDAEGRIASKPFFPHIMGEDGVDDWRTVAIPQNLCIVGSVNMDETTFGFSKKVLDRAFVIEFSTVDLLRIGTAGEIPSVMPWSSSDWAVIATSLAEHPARSSEYVQEIVDVLSRINQILMQGQLQFGYRVRDEVTMFCAAANQCSDSFVTTGMGTVDPLDIAIAMKVLPRIQGGGTTIKKILEQLHAWAVPESREATEELDVSERVGFPFSADRIQLMLTRLKEAGFTNYWL